MIVSELCLKMHVQFGNNNDLELGEASQLVIQLPKEHKCTKYG